jgi:hypothetical protein
MISKRTKAALAEAKRRETLLGNPRIEEPPRSLWPLTMPAGPRRKCASS